MEEIALAASKEAITAASSGNPGAVLVLVLVLFVALVGVLGIALIKERGKRPSDLPPNCPPPGGCPDIGKLSAQVAGLTEQIRQDREERREHRQEVRESVTRIHERLDDTVTQGEMARALTMTQHAQEEMNRVLAAVTALIETVRTAPSRRRASPAKRSAS